MTPTKQGQIVKFHTPFPDEGANQHYVVLQIKIDGIKDRADIRPLGTNLPFPPINTVKLSDLEVVLVSTDDLLGEMVTIRKSDTSEITSKVLSSNEKNIVLDLSKEDSGVNTNVHLKILDEKGGEHEGTLVIR